MSTKLKELMETPTASLEITSNNTYDVTEKAQVVVNVPNPSTGKLTITDTAEKDVTNYAQAQVVDDNLVASNIKKDVSILGVTGSANTYDIVSSVPSTKSTDIIYNTGDSSYYLWETLITGRVGGRIFYIHNDNGATYTFYDQNFNELSTQTVAGLENAYYYYVEGTPTADKFYVYDNTDHTYSGQSIIGGLVQSDYSSTGLYWGYYETTTGATANTIGSGKTNTNTVLGMGVPTDYTPNIWGYVKDCRDNSLNGCNDWFVASNAEQDQLRASNLVNWYSSNYIWSSVEFTSINAYYWYCGSSTWGRNFKDRSACAFAVRAF